MSTKIRTQIIAGVLASSLFCLAPCLAAGNKEFTAGVNSYKAKDYKKAADHFGKSIQMGQKTAIVWLYSGHCFAALGQYQRAIQTYEIVTKSFAGTAEATAASQAIDSLKAKMNPQPAVPAASDGKKSATPPPPAGADGLMGRIDITPPKFGHPAVSQGSVTAARDAIAALPKPLRKMLDESDARVILSPNMIDRWPESLKDLPENDPAPTMAELPGRIYGKDMCVYERPKSRGSTGLKEARPPKFIRLQVGNMCFQLLDDMMTLSRDPGLRKEWQADKENIPSNVADRLATFMKDDDWGPRETCSELFGSMLGGFDENTDLLYRYFPKTKAWLSKKLGV